MFILLFLTLTLLNAKEINIALVGLDEKMASPKTIKKIFIEIFEDYKRKNDIKIDAFFYSEDEYFEVLKTKKKKFDVTYMIPYVFVKNYEDNLTYSKNFVTINRFKGNTKYLLVVNKNSKIKKLKDLKNRSIIYQSPDKFSKVWLDYIIYKKLAIPSDKLLSRVSSDNKMYKKVLDLYFGKQDAIVVSKEILETSLSLNPKLKESIVVLEESPLIFPGIVGSFHKDAPDDIVDYYNNLIENRQEYLSNILELVGLKSIVFSKKEDYQEVLKFYSEYLKYEDKYK